MSSELADKSPADAPESLKEVWPLVRQWGESDDSGRGELIGQESDEDLEDLSRTVEPLLPAINAYLDETGDAERAVPFGDLAQAAIEAGFELKRRHK